MTAMIGASLGLLVIVSVAGGCACWRALRRTGAELGTLQPGRRVRDPSPAELLAEIERQLESSDYSHAYIATSSWVIRVYPDALGGHCLAVGACVTHHASDWELLQSLRLRLGIQHKPQLKLLRGGAP